MADPEDVERRDITELLWAGLLAFIIVTFIMTLRLIRGFIHAFLTYVLIFPLYRIIRDVIVIFSVIIAIGILNYYG